MSKQLSISAAFSALTMALFALCVSASENAALHNMAAEGAALHHTAPATFIKLN